MTSDNLPGRLAGGWGEPGPECLSDEELSLLRSDTNVESAGKRLDHVAGCDWCGRRLKAFIALADGEPDVTVMKPRRALPRWAQAAAAAAVIVAGVMGWRVYTDPARRSARLLAEALESERTSDWRVGDGKWARRDLRRSDRDPRPAALLEAEAILARESAAHEEDARWLEMRGRADILEFRYGPAIDLLRKAADAGGNSAELLTDLAVAYGLHAEQANQPSDYAAVVDYATRALHLRPAYPRALFNRALAFERLYMVDRAAEDWEQYLKVETDAGWKAEAAEHLQALRKTQGRRRQMMSSDESSDAILDARAVEWLVSDRKRAQAAGARLLERYHDRWLAEAAAEPVDSTALWKAVATMQTGEADEVLRLSRAAIELYHHAPAHRARAQLEQVNALNRSMRAAPCAESAARLVPVTQARGYPWIGAQALLRGSICEAFDGPFGQANRGPIQARSAAAANGLQDVELRAIGFLADIRTQAGDLWAAWQDNRDALRRLAESPSPPTRIQQCIATYSHSAQFWGWRAAGFEFMAAAADVIRATPNRMAEGVDRARAASLAQEAGFWKEAAGEASQAQRIFLSLPDSVTRTRFLNQQSIHRAESDLATGRPAAAVDALNGLVKSAVLPQDRWRAHQLLGLGLLQLQQHPRAMEEMRTAIAEMNRRADSLRDRADRRRVLLEGAVAYRALATALVADGSANDALSVWLQARGSRDAPDLVYLALDDGYAVWSSRGTQLHHISADRAKVRSSITRLLRLAGDPRSSLADLRREGRFLYDRLLRPIELPLDRDTALVLSPDAELAALPFDLLVDPNGRWLAERFPLSVASSSTSPAAGREHQVEHALVVAAANFRQALPSLPEARSEAGLVADHFANAVVLEGSAATSSAVAAELSNAEVFHYAGHGFTAGGLTGVYLADTPLTPLFLHGRALSVCRLAMLSACLTGIGGASTPSETPSLVSALLDAGVGAVVASRWEVDSHASLVIASKFYANFQEAGDAARSLWAATTALRADPQFAHPFYWGPYQIYQ
jgi:CHAT domain-containing protein